MTTATLVLTQSSAGAFATCPRKYYWRYERGLVPRELSPALEIGRLFHDLLATYLGGATIKQTLATVKAMTDEGAMARFLFERYIERYPDDKKEWEPLAIEKLFSVPLMDGVVFKGRIDAVMQQRRKPKQVWLWEHKTAGFVDNTYLARLPLNFQVTAYTYAAYHVRSIPTPRGCLYNIVGKPRLYRRAGEVTGEYLARATGEYRTQPQTFFLRPKLIRGETNFGEFVDTMVTIAGHIVTSKEGDFWPAWGPLNRQPGACFPFRSRDCDYAPLCLRGETAHVLTGFKREDPHIELKPRKERRHGKKRKGRAAKKARRAPRRNR